MLFRRKSKVPGFNPPQSYQLVRKKKLIRLHRPFELGDLESWDEPVTIVEATVAGIDPNDTVYGQPGSELIAELKEQVKADARLIAFATRGTGDNYCWDPDADTGNGEFAIRYYGQGNDYLLAPTFPLFLFRLLLEELNVPLDAYTEEGWENYDGKDWDTVCKRVTDTFKIIGSAEMVAIVEGLLSREIEEDKSVFAEGERAEIRQRFFSADYLSDWEPDR